MNNIWKKLSSSYEKISNILRIMWIYVCLYVCLDMTVRVLIRFVKEHLCICNFLLLPLMPTTWLTKTRRNKTWVWNATYFLLMSLSCLFNNTYKTSQSIELLIAISSYHHENRNRYIKINAWIRIYYADIFMS